MSKDILIDWVDMDGRRWFNVEDILTIFGYKYPVQAMRNGTPSKIHPRRIITGTFYWDNTAVNKFLEKKRACKKSVKIFTDAFRASQFVQPFSSEVNLVSKIKRAEPEKSKPVISLYYNKEFFNKNKDILVFLFMTTTTFKDFRRLANLRIHFSHSFSSWTKLFEGYPDLKDVLKPYFKTKISKQYMFKFSISPEDISSDSEVILSEFTDPDLKEKEEPKQAEPDPVKTGIDKDPLIYMKVSYFKLTTNIFSNKIYDKSKIYIKEFDRLTNFFQWLVDNHEISVFNIYYEKDPDHLLSNGNTEN